MRSFACGLALVLVVTPREPLLAEVTVGMEGRLEIVLPFDDLATKEVDPEATLYLRLAGKAPGEQGTAYDFRYFGMEPATHDLRAFLIRTSGEPMDALPPMPVTIASLLPPDHDARLNPPEPLRLPWLWGYRWGMGILAAAWVGGLVWWWWRRPRPPSEVAVHQGPAGPTLADRLQPLVVSAARQELSLEEKARLERLLIQFWRQRLQLGTAPQSEVLAAMRRHPKAGALLAQLDDWLHRPAPTLPPDLPGLLDPYRQEPMPEEPVPESATP